MNRVIIDSNAVTAAQNAVARLLDQVRQERDRQDALHARLNQSLLNAGQNFLHDLTHFDPGRAWDDLELGYASYLASEARGAIEWLRNDLTNVANRLKEAHRGTLDAVIDEHSGAVHAAISNALEHVWQTVNMLSPGRVLELLSNPWCVLDPVRAGGDQLGAAAVAGERLSWFLLWLAEGNDDILSVIEQLCIPPLIEWGQPAPSHPYTQHPTETAPTPSQNTLARQMEIANVANQLQGQLDPSTSLSLDPAWMKQHGYDALAQQVFALSSHYWSYSNMQCIAFVTLTMAIVFKKPTAFPWREDADKIWADSGTKPDANWARIRNGSGTPQPGDVIVMQDVESNGAIPYGHVAIVASVSPVQYRIVHGNREVYQTVTVYESNSGKYRIGTFTMINGQIPDGAPHLSYLVNPPAKVHTVVQGYLRYTGQ